MHKWAISTSSTVKSRHLSLFGHMAHMNGKAKVNHILFELVLCYWRPPGWLQSTWLKNITNNVTLLTQRYKRQKTQLNTDLSVCCWTRLVLNTHSAGRWYWTGNQQLLYNSQELLNRDIHWMNRYRFSARKFSYLVQR